ncbi:MAG: tRNA (adenosine(37)-N6)-threonylcarbamoyltransferase complex transferase subunit TsaD [Deltaproteobacteria bacterium]|nr:tRNA (adenosine(37)-N6)-threonylcarbamoyltransferase complex transferase subunit TsaD [Deltaproteobacteria bacterium]
MLVLALESSCDDTSVAILKDGSSVLSNIVASQDDIHSLYGGIVPELASRKHIENVIPVMETALKKANTTIEEIDAFAVTMRPGLVGSILIGLNFIKSVAYATGKPYVGVNHIEAHALSAFLSNEREAEVTPQKNFVESKELKFPFVSLVVSGGHTTLFFVKDFDDLSVLGQTRDDAAGEAFDKVAKLLGLGYPGGPIIDKLAKEGDPKAYEFKRSYIKKGNLEFSFSGLKTGVLNVVKGIEAAGRVLTDLDKKNIAASFQESAVDVLVKKALWAAEEVGVTSIVCAGGVACNSRLREKLRVATKEIGLSLFIPKPKYCSDNGAMIGLLGFELLKRGKRAGLDLNAEPS